MYLITCWPLMRCLCIMLWSTSSHRPTVTQLVWVVQLICYIVHITSYVHGFLPKLIDGSADHVSRGARQTVVVLDPPSGSLRILQHMVMVVWSRRCMRERIHMGRIQMHSGDAHVRWWHLDRISTPQARSSSVNVLDGSGPCKSGHVVAKWIDRGSTCDRSGVSCAVETTTRTRSPFVASEVGCEAGLLERGEDFLFKHLYRGCKGSLLFKP